MEILFSIETPRYLTLETNSKYNFVFKSKQIIWGENMDEELIKANNC